MSDRYNPLGVTSLIRPQLPDIVRPFGGMSDYEKQLDPIYDQKMAAEEQRRRRMKPVQWIFDRLQTGQYVSANLANEIIDAFDRDPNTKPEFLKAIWEGVTGKTKGSYTTIVRDRLGLGTQKVFSGVDENRRLGQVDYADIVGFLGDVLLDPLTWVGFGAIGNSTKLAKSAADEFADNAVRIMFRNLSDSPQLAQKALGHGGQKAVDAALAVGGEKGMDILRRAGGDLGAVVNRAYKEARTAALSKTQTELSQFIEAAARSGTQTPAMERIVARTASGGAFPHAGERWGARVFGREVLQHPTTGIKREFGERSWKRFERLFAGDAGKPTLRQAVWSKLNRSVLGDMWRAVGIGNPYQKFLRTKQVEDGVHFAAYASSTAMSDVMKPISGLSDTDLGEFWKLFAARESAEKALREQVAGGGMAITATIPETITASSPAVADAVKKVSGVLDGWWAEESRIAANLGETAAEYRKWYLPEFFTERAAGAGGGITRMRRQYTFGESMAREMDLTQALWKVDRDTAYDMVEKQLTGMSTDPRALLANRALVHGRVRARGELVQQMKEFGINLADSADPTAAALNISGRNLSSLGLRSIPNDALTGYLFDADVANILERALDVTGRNMNPFQKVMKSYATWWKSIVTMTTGFHARNFISNTVTQFLRHGTRAFKKDELMMATAAVAATMRESSRKAFLGELGATPEWMNKWLERRVGNFTVRELADRAAREGVISHATMGFDAPKIAESLTARRGGALWQGKAVRPGKGLLWSERGLREASRAVGSHIENIPRMQSFLIDYGDMAVKQSSLSVKGGAKEMQKALLAADDPGLQYAARQSRKWFLDYEDLTDFEQKTMKSVVPFYCVPDDTEALTRGGWKKHDEISVGDEILTWNMKTLKQQWQPVQAMNRFDFNESLEQFSGKYGTFQCTSNHRWPVEVRRTRTKGKWYGGDVKIVEAADLNTSHLLKLAAETDDQESILSPREAAILGWVVTDGYFRWRGNNFESVIYQKKSKAVNIIRELCALYLTSEAVHPDTGTICFRLSSVWSLKVQKYFKTKEDLPALVTRLSNKAAKAMWESMLLAEGHVNQQKRFTAFAQKPGPVLDAFQILSQLLGKPFGISTRENKSRWGSGMIGVGYVRGGANLKAACLKRTLVGYKGTVWCPTVENGTWVMRQNGKPIITGNSWMRKNFANQISGIALYPDLYSILPKVEDLVRYEDPNYDPALVPEWLREAGAFPVANLGDGKMRMFRPDFAHMDLNLIPLEWEPGSLWPHLTGTQLRDELINSTAPWVRRLVGAMIHTENPYSFFYQEEMQPTSDAPYLMRLFASRPGSVALVDGLMRAAGFANGASIDVESGKLKIDSHMAVALQEFLPVIRQLDFAFYLPQTIGTFSGEGPVERAIEDFTGAQDSYEGAEQFFQMLSYYMGIKFKAADLEQEKMRLGKDIYSQAASDLSAARRENNPATQVRSREAQIRREQSIRRLNG